jgi:hypothetical protein
MLPALPLQAHFFAQRFGCRFAAMYGDPSNQLVDAIRRGVSLP